MAKIMLLANANPGLEIAKFISSLKEDEISALYVSGNYPEIDEKIINNSKVCKDRVFSAESIKDKNHIDWLKSENIDVLITVYWPYLLKKDFFRLAKKTVNFHPALLPVNRGWYPHVHSLIDGSASGVTLHAIDENADTGPIVVLEEHSKYGGLGSLISEVASGSHPVRIFQVAVNDCFSQKCGTYEYLLKEHELDFETAYKNIHSFLLDL